MNLNQVREARLFFPLAPTRTAVRQAIRLVLAKEYMASKGIVATATASKFHYERSAGSVLQ